VARHPYLCCPDCTGSLFESGGTRLRCQVCDRAYPIDNGIACLRVPGDARTENVREFYTEAPFPGYPPRDSLISLRARAARSEFARLLDAAIAPDAVIAELGCGTGQMSLFLASADRTVVAADLTRASLELGARAAREFGCRRVHFVETDLRRPGLAAGSFDVVYSSGVLHHTPDPADSFAKLVRLVRPGGFVVLGLYNSYARLVHRARRAIARVSRYRWFGFDPVLRERKREPDRWKAWLRDQYLHPEEHRHTLAEVQGWFRKNGIEYVRAYPNPLIGADPLVGGALFEPANDNWRFENVLAQLSWTRTLSHEGGLWVTVGHRPDTTDM
jgi:SAM-dependent methyltransferase